MHVAKKKHACKFDVEHAKNFYDNPFTVVSKKKIIII